MDRINSADGLFHEGNPSTGVKGTKVTADWLNALQEEVIGAGGNIDSYAVETTLDEENGIIFVSAGAPLHLPVYAAVSPKKRYTIKNIGAGVVPIDSLDGKTIDGQAAITLDNAGDRCTIVKDGANWQTI
jgi:cysteine synthase